MWQNKVNTSSHTMVEINLANWEPIAKAAYLAYGAAVEFKSFHGEPLKEWDELGDRIQQAWIAVSKKAAEEVLKAQ